MHFTDRAFVLSVRRHAEHNGIIKVLSKDHGVIGGLARGVAGKTGRGLWQPGNAVMVSWKARLPDQLGTLTGELMEPVASRLMARADALSALLSAAALVSILLPERAPHPRLYQSMHQ
ncbi:MAG: recombination protein O N-terminal domain-containing protein, partial [Alphaproteobacteria bacterium]|nr:recombination protein O N-terminal domain-containing protein [Alphaproteobacteria bacterium]